MPLRDDLEKIRDRAIATLNDAHDYFTYTKDAWRTLQQDVQFDGRHFTWQNKSTTSSITEKDVLARARRYVQVELASSTLQASEALGVDWPTVRTSVRRGLSTISRR